VPVVTTLQVLLFVDDEKGNFTVGRRRNTIRNATQLLRSSRIKSELRCMVDPENIPFTAGISF
jgi:hypothetical protein